MATKKSNMTSDDVDQAALAEAERAGLNSPSAISDTAIPTIGELHQRIQVLENALKDRVSHVGGMPVGQVVEDTYHLVNWLFGGSHRGVNKDAIIQEGRETLANKG